MKKIIGGCLVAVLIVALSALATFGFFAGGFGSIKDKLGMDKFQPRLKVEDLLKGRMNILVMGVDARKDDVGRSDTLMIFMVDPKSEKVEIMSVPRDTLVKIPGRGWDKINHAYAYGGHELTRATVEDFLGIKLNHYVLIDVQGFKNVVDAIGGVDINVEKRMYYEDPWDDDPLVIDFQPGLQHMDGQKAMEYVRYRDEEGDIGRIARQQQFMKAVYEKVTSPANIPNLPRLTAVLAKMVKTDVYASKVPGLANSVTKAVKNGLKGSSVPGKPKYIGDISYWVPDVEETREIVVKMQGVDIVSRAYQDDTTSLAADYKQATPPRNVDDSDSNTEKDKKAPVTKEQKDAKEQPLKDPKAPPVAAKDKQETASIQAKEQADNTTVAETKTLNVVLVKCTDNPEALDKMSSLLASRNMKVVAVREGEIRPNTTMVSSTNNPAVLSRLFKLPFNTGLRTSNSSNASVDVVIFVGSDFK